MSNNSLPTLCGIEGCRLIQGHNGNHNLYPKSAWRFMDKKDRDKLTKAGFATPRGGTKGAYQNHVLRNNRVIVPFERLPNAPLSEYQDGYVIRIYPEQYFQSLGIIKGAFLYGENKHVKIGENAFLLYRTHEAFHNFPPLDGWSVRRLLKNGNSVNERGRDVIDVGHYVLRLSAHGNQPKRVEGAPQGIFAPEYADQETNFLSQCVLAWLIIHTHQSPYTTSQALHLQAILNKEGFLDSEQYECRGAMRHGLCGCPLCLRIIRYSELHEMVAFDNAVGNENAANQVQGATRSTIVNLFHLKPLRYDTIAHIPGNIAWGHAVCNTRLGQRTCVSLSETMEMDLKVGIIYPERIETFAWMTTDQKMIRSPDGAVWIQLHGDIADGPPPGTEEEGSVPESLDI